MVFHIGDKVIHWTYGLGEIETSRKKLSTETPQIATSSMRLIQ
jgi:hypothetical protein